MWSYLNLTNPGYEEANMHYNLGNTYAKRERYDDAIKEYKKSIELEPNHISRYHNLAYTYGLRRETYREAIETWRKVLTMGQKSQSEYHIKAATQEIRRLTKELEARD